MRKTTQSSRTKVRDLILFCFTLIFLVLPSITHAKVCSKNVESLPILSNGRVKPLAVHAKQVIKFISGKAKYEDKSATEIYCELSLSLLIQDHVPLFPAFIKVDHIKTREFLEIDKNKNFIDLPFAIGKISEMEKQALVFKSRNDKSSFANDLNNVILRTKLYSSIVQGEDWKLPILMGHGDESPHTTNKTSEKNLEWISLYELVQIFPDDIKTPEEAVRAITNAGTKYAKIDSKHLFELTVDKLHLFQWSMLAVLMALILTAVYKKPNHTAVLISLVLVFAIEIAAVYTRIKISGRAPVTNMYETVMWVGIGGLFFATVLAFLRKEKLFLLVGLGLNLACLFMMTFANNMLDPAINPLVPVLRDNFWLSTHVTCVTISYAAFALSWLVANTYLVKSIFKTSTREETNRLNILSYDCIKIGVVLLATGTILGGIWADYSWGRFWGWDPKETWALIALLAYIAILHGRYAGWINQTRFLPAVALAFLSILMTWFGVNYILAAGLHSYGFSNGGTIFLTSFFVGQFGILASYFWRESLRKKI